MSELTMIRASDVLNQALPTGMPPVTDDDILGNCIKCKREVPLGTCSVRQGTETTYICSSCGSTLLVIGAPNPDGEPWPGRGYRLNDFVLRNAVDLRLGRVLIPRSPAALDTKRA